MDKTLKWSDLKIGDVIRDGHITKLVTGIDSYSHAISIDTRWLDDADLREWKKVEESGD